MDTIVEIDTVGDMKVKVLSESSDSAILRLSMLLFDSALVALLRLSDFLKFRHVEWRVSYSIFCMRRHCAVSRIQEAGKKPKASIQWIGMSNTQNYSTLAKPNDFKLICSLNMWYFYLPSYTNRALAFNLKCFANASSRYMLRIPGGGGGGGGGGGRYPLIRAI